MRSGVAVLAAWAWMTLTGCDTDSLGRGNVRSAAAGCNPTIALCDVQQTSCQRHIFSATACQRDQETGEMPPIRSITSAQFAAELRAETQPLPSDAWDIGLSLLGLIEASDGSSDVIIDTLVEGVLGFYDPRTAEVTLLSDATGLSREEKVLVLSHEFVHVLQDRAVGLARFDRARTSDGVVASDALTEGEAVLHSNVALTRRDVDPEDLDWRGYYRDMRDGVFDTLDASSSPLIDAILNLPYPIGGAAVTDLWLEEGQIGVDALYGEGRVTTLVDWLEGYPDGLARATGRLDCTPPDAPPGYELYGEDVFGVAGVAALWAAQRGDAATGWQQAAHWRGGSTWVFAEGGDAEGPPDGSLLVWHTVWDSADAARSFAELVDAEMRFRRGAASLIAATDDADALRWVADHADAWLSCDDGLKTLHKALDDDARGSSRWWPGDVRHWVTRTQLGFSAAR